MKDKFTLACERIESSNHFQLNITNRGLLDLVVDSAGRAKHTPSRSAFIIQNSPIKPPLEKNKIYQFKEAKKDYYFEDDPFPMWMINDSVILLINNNGDFSFHTRENAERGMFNLPLNGLSIDNFLKRECLPFLEIKSQIAEIKKNSAVLAQSYRTNTSFFITLPPETTGKIMSLTSNNNMIPEEDAYRIALNNLG